MRTLEEVQATLEIAKLKEEDLHKTIHCLSFGESVSSADYCLMELDDTLCKHIEAGQRYDISCCYYLNCLTCGQNKTRPSGSCFGINLSISVLICHFIYLL